ncbi:MAG: redox-regulated ATPase YchF [Candidatus Woesearchaeota archaeon]
MLIGIVGKPNVGKSTFFKALTLADVLIANYPFATIQPNKGFGHVKVECLDKEFNVKCNPRYGYCIDSKRFVPVEVIDVAGLVPGASEGKGLGNQFLDDLRQADVLIHVVDISGSTNANGEPVQIGSYDPLNDVEFLEEEIDLWVFGIVKKNWDKLIRTAKAEHKLLSDALYEQLSGLKFFRKDIEETLKEYPEIDKWNDEILFNFLRSVRRKSKPIIIAANKIDLPTAKQNLVRLKEKYSNLIVIPVSAEAELVLKEANRQGLIEYIPGESSFKILKELNERQKYALNMIKEKILDTYGSTGVQQVINTAVFDVLKYIAVFPGGVNKLADKDGNILPDCFLLPPGSTALDFARTIHTDLAKNFVKAIDVRTKKPLGKDYLLKHRDVIEIYASN